MAQTQVISNVPASQSKPDPARFANSEILVGSLGNREDFHYAPELAEWEELFSGVGKDKPTHTFSIYEPHPDGGKVCVATIQVNEKFTARNAAMIAVLMSHAPRLWRELQRAAPMVENEGIDGIEQMADIIHVLRSAAERNPFLSCRPDESEESLMRKVNGLAMPDAR
jgi:hypothetical protein